MSCKHCWCFTCTCGYEYGYWSKLNLRKQIKMLKEVLEDKNKYSKLYKEERAKQAKLERLTKIKNEFKKLRGGSQ